MTVNNFKPVLWHGALLKHFKDAHVYEDLFTRDYEGEIKDKGDTVKIISIGDPSIKDYTLNSGLGAISEIDAPEILQDTDMMLNIDQKKYFNFGLDNVDKIQAAGPVMNEAMQRAAYQLKDTIDVFCATTLNSGVASANQLTAATQVGTGAGDDDMYEIIVDLGVKLDENSVPAEGRWAVIPPWAKGMLCKDPRFVSFGTTSNNGRLVNGMGQELEINGIKVRVSNNVPVSGSAYTVIAGVKPAAAFAMQIKDITAYQIERGFADAMKGLCLYGAKVIRPYALASVAITQAA